MALTPIHLKIEGINATATENIRERYPKDQILTAVGTDKGVCGFALEVGERETYGDFEQFNHSVLSRYHLNLDRVNGAIVEYQGVFSKVTLQYQHQGLPKVWRNGSFHDWRNHYSVYQNAQGGKVPIYQGWKQGKLEVKAGGYQFSRQPR